MAKHCSHCGAVVFECGIDVDIPSLTVSIDGARRHASKKQAEILELLVTIAPRTARLDYIMSALWPGPESVEVRTVRVFMSLIRNRLLKDTSWTIKNVWGIGYRLEKRENGE